MSCEFGYLVEIKFDSCSLVFYILCTLVAYSVVSSDICLTVGSDTISGLCW